MTVLLTALSLSALMKSKFESPKQTTVATVTNENLVKVKTVERFSNDMIDREMGNILDFNEDRIQNAVLTAIHSIITRKNDFAIGSINAYSGRDATSVIENSELEGYIGIIALFENVSKKNYSLHVLNTNDETRNNFPRNTFWPATTHSTRWA